MYVSTFNRAQTLLNNIGVLKKALKETVLSQDLHEAIEIIYLAEREETKAFIKKYLDKYQKEFDEL